MSKNEFATDLLKNGVFIVKNVTKYRNKTVKIFQYPILYGRSVNLLAIRGISEAEIRASLLKGELRNKILVGDIVVLDSDIDLLQFNNQHKLFLQKAGVTKGLEVTASETNLGYSFRQEIELIGTKNGVNTIFYTPEKFINGLYQENLFHISIKHNGKDIYENIDYTIGESSPGTGYDVINFISFIPNSHSVLFADYCVKT